MAFTPTDPTKAEVRVTGTAPNQQLDFYIPRGAKGEPGGFTCPWVGTGNLDDVKTSGYYAQTNGTYATLANNYPMALGGYLLVVARLANDVVQEYSPQLHPSTGYRTKFQRHFNGTVWSPWVSYNVTRVDQTAGRVIYQWDNVNSRDQLVYGDTGWRDVIASDGLPGATGYMRIRRTGHVVELSMSATLPDATVSNATLFNIPVGFRPGSPTAVNFYYSRTSAATGQITYGLRPTSVGLEHSAAWSASWGEARLRITWTTSDNWPATLPGTAFGTIPNL